MIRWNGTEPRLAPLAPGDMVTVYLDVTNPERRQRLGLARLVRFERRPPGREPLEVWTARCELLPFGDDGPRTISTERVALHPFDRVALAADLEATGAEPFPLPSPKLAGRVRHLGTWHDGSPISRLAADELDRHARAIRALERLP